MCITEGFTYTVFNIHKKKSGDKNACLIIFAVVEVNHLATKYDQLLTECLCLHASVLHEKLEVYFVTRMCYTVIRSNRIAHKHMSIRDCLI